MEATRRSRRSFLRGAAIGAGVAAASGALPVAAQESVEEDGVQADVVVVGGGLAGLTAALRAAEDGATVVVLEKQAWPPVSNSTLCFGSCYCFDSQLQRDEGIAASVEDHYADMRKYMPWGDPDLQRAWVENIGPAVDFLMEHGVNVVPYEYPFDRWGVRIPPADFYAAVVPALEELGVQIIASTRAQRLLTNEDGEVIGVRAKGEDGKCFDVKANRGVVLAGGGFQLNNELVTRYIAHDATRATRLQRWGYGGTGDSLLMALEAGAKTSMDMDTWYGHLVFLTEDGERPEGFRMTSGGSLKFDVLCAVVNIYGKRFTDESSSSEMIAQDALKQPESVLPPYGRAFVILDDTIYQNRKGEFEAAAKQGAVMAWGVDGDQMVATIQEFNQAIEEGREAELVPPKTVMQEGGYVYTLPLLNKIETPPFYAVPTKPAITFTEGGIGIEPGGAVLDRDGNPIPRLFAAGDAVGGAASRQYVAGTGVGKAIAQGFVAGAAAAATEPLA
jgi:succinate dehydrogenase/fumarate reductase flavoprotein subunit